MKCLPFVAIRLQFRITYRSLPSKCCNLDLLTGHCIFYSANVIPWADMHWIVASDYVLNARYSREVNASCLDRSVHSLSFLYIYACRREGALLPNGVSIQDGKNVFYSLMHIYEYFKTAW